MKLKWELHKKVWPTKIVKKLQKLRFSSKSGGFSNKKSGKINTNAPKRLKYGSKWSQESTLDDPRCPQTYFFQNFGVEASKFLLSGKNGAPKSVGRV